jgi:hypothetical protein
VRNAAVHPNRNSCGRRRRDFELESPRLNEIQHVVLESPVSSGKLEGEMLEGFSKARQNPPPQFAELWACNVVS